jgi:hypothetical protein
MVPSVYNVPEELSGCTVKKFNSFGRRLCVDRRYSRIHLYSVKLARAISAFTAMHQAAFAKTPNYDGYFAVAPLYLA